MVCKPSHVNAAKTGQKVALLVEVRVAWDLRVVGTLGEVLISMVIRRGGMMQTQSPLGNYSQI